MSGPGQQGPGGGSHGGRTPAPVGGAWSPLHYRPPSPYAPSPPPRLPPGSPGMPMFAARLPYMPCPRPRWPVPYPGGAPSPTPMAGPRPYRPPPPSHTSNNEIPREFENIFKINLNSRDCNAILNTYLLDIINWAIEEKRMVAATVSNEETDFNRILLKNMGRNLEGSYKNFKYTLHLPQNLKTLRRISDKNFEPLDPYRIGVSYANEFDILPLATIDPSMRGLPPLRYENHGDFMKDIIAYNDQDGIGFQKDQNKIHEDLKMNNNLFVTTTVTTVAASTSKETDHSFHKKATTAIKANTNKTAYNFLASISLFDKLQDVFMNSLLNPYEKRDLNSEENQIDSSALGKVQENNMLKLVKTTLKSLAMQSEGYDSKILGFLLIIIGGNLSEISDPFSELIQTVKYVLEHTNKKDTLILLTCYCPVRSLENKVEKRLIPYFAGGLNSEDFKNLVCMWDVFDKMKDSVKKTWKKGKAKANQLIAHKKKNESFTIKQNSVSINHSNDSSSSEASTSTSKEPDAEDVEATNEINLQFERKKRSLDSSDSATVLIPHDFAKLIKFIFLYHILVYCFR